MESENPSYEKKVEGTYNVGSLAAPDWFSVRAGSHFYRGANKIMQDPELGFMVRLVGTSTWEFQGGASYMGACFTQLSREFYTRKLAIPAWLLFESSPLLLGETMVDTGGELVVVVQSTAVIEALGHYQRHLRDPAFKLLMEVLAARTMLCAVLRMEGKPVPLSKALRSGVEIELKLDPWYRRTVDSMEFEG